MGRYLASLPTFLRGFPNLVARPISYRQNYSHAHSDHYTNLSSSWKHGPIYCSETTANLIIHMLNVDRKWVHPLPMDVKTVLPNTGGVGVTLIEANHCKSQTHKSADIKLSGLFHRSWFLSFLLSRQTDGQCW
jgi:hypothetical protein